MNSKDEILADVLGENQPDFLVKLLVDFDKMKPINARPEEEKEFDEKLQRTLRTQIKVKCNQLSSEFSSSVFDEEKILKAIKEHYNEERRTVQKEYGPKVTDDYEDDSPSNQSSLEGDFIS